MACCAYACVDGCLGILDLCLEGTMAIFFDVTRVLGSSVDVSNLLFRVPGMSPVVFLGPGDLSKLFDLKLACGTFSNFQVKEPTGIP